MEKQTITFTKSKETDKKVRFDAPRDAKVTGSLYLTKEDAGDKTELPVEFPSL
jgi:hypothetical protein